MTTLLDSAPARVRTALRRAGNPFRNYFARNPDDETCARYHVPELFTAERDLLHAIIDLYRYDPLTHSEVVPILGNKGAGKTHLLHSIKHGVGGAFQLVVTPGVYQRESDFLEYLLFQMLDTLLGGGRQKGLRPLAAVGERLVCQQLGSALKSLSADERADLFPVPGFGKWARRLGLGTAQAVERADWLAEQLAPATPSPTRAAMPLAQALQDAGLSPADALALLTRHAAKTDSRAAAGLMREQVIQGFAKAVLLGDETDLANFLTYGFAELEFQVRPTRQDLVLALLKVVMELLRSLKVPVVVAFDQLEDLLLARRSDEGHKIAEAFFAGIVQVMHQIDGICFLVFAERGLWNRFVPSLDGYIQDRLNNPVHVPQLGTVKAIRLEAPPVPLVRRVVEARLRPVLAEAGADLGETYPFTDEQITRIGKTEPTLRDMLQQFRHLFDHVIYDAEDAPPPRIEADVFAEDAPPPDVMTPHDKQNRIEALLGTPPSVEFKSVTIVETPADPVGPVAIQAPESAAGEVPPAGTFPGVAETPADRPAAVSRELPPAALVAETPTVTLSRHAMAELWESEFRAAKRRLEPEGALTGSTRELQSALGLFLATCHEHGVKVGPWRLQHVVPEYPFGDHPTYGAVSLAHWACQDGQPWRVAVGLFLARGAGKPKDLEIKLGVADQKPQVVDHTILLRPEDDTALTGKSKTVWQDAERRGHHARVESVTLETFALLQSVPRWLAAVSESLPAGTPMPNLADVIQERAERLLEQVCMPVTLG